MKTVQLHEAKAHLSELIDALQKGEEVSISKQGKPVAKLSAIIKDSNKRELGFHPIIFKSDLLEPSSQDVTDTFYNS